MPEPQPPHDGWLQDETLSARPQFYRLGSAEYHHLRHRDAVGDTLYADGASKVLRTIEKQYIEHRGDLFANKEVLPEFASLTTVKAVQSIAGNPVGFDSWFDALEWMKREIDKKVFDVALLGCGAYAMPLAAHIKRHGHKAVHMGGVLQFMFGIKVKRYIDEPPTAQYIN